MPHRAVGKAVGPGDQPLALTHAVDESAAVDQPGRVDVLAGAMQAAGAESTNVLVAIGERQAPLAVHESVPPHASVRDARNMGVGAEALGAAVAQHAAVLGNRRGPVVGRGAGRAPDHQPAAVDPAGHLGGDYIGRPHELQAGGGERVPEGDAAADELLGARIPDELRARAPCALHHSR